MLQEGFLLGELIHKEAIVITDSDQQHVKISKIIKINSVVACPHNHYISSPSGELSWCESIIHVSYTLIILRSLSVDWSSSFSMTMNPH